MVNNDIFSNIPEIRTERLHLRKIKIEDVNDFFEYSSNQDVTKYLSYTHTGIDEALEYINNKITQYEEGSCMIWGIEDLKSRKYIGACGYTHWDQDNKNAEIAYTLNKDFWGIGLGSEIFSELLKFGFNNMKLNRIEAKCWKENEKSHNLMIKNGMKTEGILRGQWYIKNEFRDVIVCSMLKNEFYSKK